MHAKLTLRLENGLIKQAKAYAKRRGKSVSQLVADYFRTLGCPSAELPVEMTPIARALKGSLHGAKVDAQDIKRHWKSRYL